MENPFPVIKVIGVGGGGCNAVRSMIEAGLEGVKCILSNTSFPNSLETETYLRIQLGGTLTSGLGAGSDPEIGRKAAQESAAEIAQALSGADLVFVVAGMGGGTGTGAAPVVAEIARNAGILTVGLVTKPFSYEGKHRLQQADNGIGKLKLVVDSLMIISNDKLRELGIKGVSIRDAFRPANLVLHQAIRGIYDLMFTNGHINLDFADLRTIMSNRGLAIMGIGSAEGEMRARQATQMAISNQLLEGFDISKAKGVLINVAGPSSMSMDEFHLVTELIHEQLDEETEVITGFVVREDMGEAMQVTVIATGVESKSPSPVDPVKLIPHRRGNG